MKVEITGPAKSDLRDIGTWIAADKPKAAARMVDRLLCACEGLSSLARRYPEIQMRSLRKRPVGDYLIFYRIGDRIEIVRILHAARDWPTLLDEA